MNVYLAARYSRNPEMRVVEKALVALGHAVTSRWIRGTHKLPEGAGAAAAAALRAAWAAEDLEDLEAADVVVAFTEEPRAERPGTPVSRGGRHVEFGYALGRKMPVVVVGWRENVFHCLPQVCFCPTWEEARLWFTLEDVDASLAEGAEAR
jgi:nucleoside 2-deoxyribosyltransferase